MDGRLILALAAVVTLTAGCFGSSSSVSAPASPIRHIVVILQENHSFDNLLGRWCYRHHRCDGVVSGKLSSGKVIPLREPSDRVRLMGHSNRAHSRSWNNGAMDGFNRVRGCGAAHHFRCYVQYRRRDIPNFARLAGRFVVADRIFESNGVPSWGSHLELATGGDLDGFTGRNPPGIPRNGWGCDSLLDAPWRPAPGAPIQMEPSCIPDRAGNGPYRSSPVQWIPTIMDRLDAAGRSWRLYTEGGTRSGFAYGWAICPTFADCLYTGQASNDVPVFDVLHDANAGTLPAFSVVTPPSKLSQRNGYSMLNGDNYIGQIMSALMHSPEWDSTAVIITYDDYGGFYDHVPSPDGTDAIRLPFIIVSPWAKPGYTDHSYGSLDSIDAFVEHTFGLQPLTARDATAYDLHNAFDFAQSPQPAVPMTRTPVPRQELRAIRHHPPPADVT